jgi:branched-chain amino acid transport system substrate-binding protein
MHRLVKRGFLIATVASLLAATACSSPSSTNGGGTTAPKGDSTGVTATEILVGTHQPLTGPAAASYSSISAATHAYFDAVNAKGGVNGRKITYKIVDDGYNPANTVTVVNQLILQDKVFALLNGLGTPTHTGVLDIIKDNNVPDLFIASGSINWNQPDKYPDTFGYQTDYVTDYKILGTYVKNTWPGKKVCFFGQSDDFGANSLTGLKLGLGADPVSQDVYTVGATSFVAQMTKFKTAGCEVIVTATLTAYTGVAIATAAGIGLAAQFVTSGTGGDYQTLVGGQALKAHPELANGLVSSSYLPAVTNTTDPWVAGFKKLNDQYNSGHPFDGNALYGMSVGYLFVQALLAAGKDLTREGLLAAVEKNGFKGPGLAPYGYSKTNHSGFTGVQLGKITNGVQAAFGPVYVTDQKSGPVTEYTQPAITPPTDMIPTA